jgi:hypothetical protein
MHIVRKWTMMCKVACKAVESGMWGLGMWLPKQTVRLLSPGAFEPSAQRGAGKGLGAKQGPHYPHAVCGRSQELLSCPGKAALSLISHTKFAITQGFTLILSLLPIWRTSVRLARAETCTAGARWATRKLGDT